MLYVGCIQAGEPYAYNGTDKSMSSVLQAGHTENNPDNFQT